MRMEYKLICTKESNHESVKDLKRLARSHAKEGLHRGSLIMSKAVDTVFVNDGTKIWGQYDSKEEARQALRTAGWCPITKTEWRPRYDGAPWMA